MIRFSLLKLRSNNKWSLTQFIKQKLSLSRARSDILYAANIMLHEKISNDCYIIECRKDYAGFATKQDRPKGQSRRVLNQVYLLRKYILMLTTVFSVTEVDNMLNILKQQPTAKKYLRQITLVLTKKTKLYSS